MAQCVLRIQSRHVLIISLNKVNFPFLLIQTGARKDPSICEKTHEARDAKKQKKKRKAMTIPLCCILKHLFLIILLHLNLLHP